MDKMNKPEEAVEEGKMSGKIDYDEIKKLIALLEEKNLALFELEIEGLRIKISRNVPGQVSYHPLAAPVTQHPVGTPLTGASSAGPEHIKESGEDAHAVKSPMVGTFYRAPAPNADPFVEIGDIVKKGQTLCIIEAMKLMNEIESDADGVVEAIHVENGKPVEYGQRLFSIKTAA